MRSRAVSSCESDRSAGSQSRASRRGHRPRRARTRTRGRPGRRAHPDRAPWRHRCRGGCRRRAGSRFDRRRRSTTSGRTFSVAATPSSCRPPWFDTTMAFAPTSIARRASSPIWTPLTTIGPDQASRIQLHVLPADHRLSRGRRRHPRTASTPSSGDDDVGKLHQAAVRQKAGEPRWLHQELRDERQHRRRASGSAAT